MLAEFFTQNLDTVFFVYGLAFFVMGLIIFAQPRKARSDSVFRLSDIIWMLAGFGVIHGVNEWLDMVTIIRGHSSNAWSYIRVTTLTLSYVFLFEFGRRLIRLSLKKFLNKWITLLISILVVAFIFISNQEESIWPRYFLGFPAGMMTAFGFYLYYRSNKALLEPFGLRRDFFIAAISMGVYGVLGGVIVPKADFVPASIINNPSFLNLIGIPVQVFRAGCAILLAWSVWSILSIFDWEMKAKLKNSEKLATMGKFASIIGHEFRNQLGVMGISVYFLKTKLHDADEKVKRHLVILDQQIMETNRVIENILSFSKNKELKFENLDLENLLSAAINKVQKPKGIEIVTQIDKNLRRIEADEIQLDRVFVNIISNAIEAMEEKGRLTITATKINNSFEILFEDTGPGIKGEDRSRIFEPFFSTKTHGIGLGLSISKSIIEAHGGSIKIESGVSKGAVVTVRLPIGGYKRR